MGTASGVRSTPLPTAPRREADPPRVGGAADHHHADPARRRAHAEREVTGAVPSRRHDIADDLRQQITTGRLKPGERLPSESGLAAQYKVGTVTLRHALAVLQGEGLVKKIHGKGNFVRCRLRKIMYVGGWGTLDPWTAAEAALRVTVRSTTLQAHGHLTTFAEGAHRQPSRRVHLHQPRGRLTARPGPHLHPARPGPGRRARRRILGAGCVHEIRRPRSATGRCPRDGMRPPTDPGRSVWSPDRLRLGGPRDHTRRDRLHRSSRRSRAPGLPRGPRRRRLHHPPRDR